MHRRYCGAVESNCASPRRSLHHWPCAGRGAALTRTDPTRTHADPRGPMRTHADPCGPSRGPTQAPADRPMRIDAERATAGDPDPNPALARTLTRTHADPRGPTRTHADPCGPTWTHADPRGLTQTQIPHWSGHWRGPQTDSTRTWSQLTTGYSIIVNSPCL